MININAMLKEVGTRTELRSPMTLLRQIIAATQFRSSKKSVCNFSRPHGCLKLDPLLLSRMQHTAGHF